MATVAAQDQYFLKLHDDCSNFNDQNGCTDGQ